MKVYKYYQDPSHGWIAVKRSEIERFGLLQHISVYSFQRGQTVYLEHHRDADLFLNAKKAAGEKFELVVKHTDANHPIRSYDHFPKNENLLDAFSIAALQRLKFDSNGLCIGTERN